MKSILLIILLTLSFQAFGQELEKKPSVSILIGAKTRVTPIYLKRIPDAIYVGSIDILQQPDKHLSGPGIHISEKYMKGIRWSLAFHQTIRRDYIYRKMPLAAPEPGVEYNVKQKILFDIYTDVARDIPANNSSFRILIGLGICGLNSGYIETRRVSQSSTTYTDYYTKKNFIFPATTAGVGWQKNKFYAELKIGYCSDNPTLFKTPFLFPEISCQYQLFNLNKD